jgi:hypothetical protein
MSSSMDARTFDEIANNSNSKMQWDRPGKVSMPVHCTQLTICVLRNETAQVVTYNTLVLHADP